MGEDEDHSSTNSSSSSSSSNNPSPITNELPISQKRKAGRKKFKETRHPIYRAVRRRNGSKWVCEVREPNKKSRIWLGTFPTPEMAARAHDVAALALRGETAALNFSDSAWLLKRAKSSLPRDIQKAALEAAMAFRPSSSKSLRNVMRPSSIDVKSLQEVSKPPSLIMKTSSVASGIDSTSVNKGSEKVWDSSTTTFLDEEALFNMPGLLDSMAEGLLITPLAMKRGLDWSGSDSGIARDIDLTLWED